MPLTTRFRSSVPEPLRFALSGAVGRQCAVELRISRVFPGRFHGSECAAKRQEHKERGLG